MCDFCNEVEKGQPNLGSGAFLSVTNASVAISGTNDDGVRITQVRDVSYVGPEGTEVRHEVESIYLAWDEVTQFLINLIAMQQNFGKTENDT
jgi:hypothetical protein